MSIIIQPLIANIINASLIGLMSFGLLFTPQKFMNGGAYQSPWFKNIENIERDNKLFYFAQFMGFIMIGSCLIPTFIDPESQFLCYQMSIVHGISLVHTLLFLFTDMYKEARPDNKNSLYQWYFMTSLNVVIFIITLLATIHNTENVIDSKASILPKETTNIIMLVFSSFFGISFVGLPQYLISTFWQDETIQPIQKFMGFDLLKLTDLEYWWIRCIGLTIIGLNIAFLVRYNLKQPLYSIGSLIVISLLNLFNFHQVTMRPYKTISTRHIQLSWVPNIILGCVMVALLACSNIYI